MTVELAAVSISQRKALVRYINTTDPFSYKPKSHPLFGYGTGQSNIEPAFTDQPDVPALVANENVLVWCSDGEGANWDFRVADPSLDIFNDYLPYDAMTNPNGRDIATEPYSGYPCGQRGLATLGAALQYHEQTGRKVYFGNTAWAGQNSTKWKPGVGECAIEIDAQMTLMVARLAVLEPDLEIFTWDFLLINQGTGDVLNPAETYADNWEEWLDYVGAYTLDGDDQEVPSKWMDRRRTHISLMQRARRDEVWPTWNGQEVLQRRRKENMTLVPSANRAIQDAGGLNVHFWGNVQTDFGRDCARMSMATGIGPDQNQIDFTEHKDSTIQLEGVYGFGATAGSIADPGSATIKFYSTTHVLIHKTDVNADSIDWENLEVGDQITLYDRLDRATKRVLEVSGAVTDNTTWVSIPYTVVGVPTLTVTTGYGVEAEATRRVIIDEETADALYKAPYKRVGINHTSTTMPNATAAVKAHDADGLVFEAESVSTGDTRIWVKMRLREALGLVEAFVSAKLSLLMKGVTNTLKVLDQATGVARTAITIKAQSNTIPLVMLHGQVCGSIKAVNNTTPIALSGFTISTPMWTEDGYANGVLPVYSFGALQAKQAGYYRIKLLINEGTMTASKRTYATVTVNNVATSAFGEIWSNSGTQIATLSVECTALLAVDDIVGLYFTPIDGATTITPKHAELYAELTNAT